MHATLPRLETTDFPAIRRGRLETLQVNVGYKCNQSCVHCHVNAGPTRTEMMDWKTVSEIVSFLGAIVTAGALGYTQKRKDHIVVDILSEKFPAPVKRVLDGVSFAILLVLFSIVSWQTFV